MFEPLVRLHKINRHARRGKTMPRPKQIFGVRWLGAPDAISKLVIVIPFCLRRRASRPRQIATCRPNTLVRTTVIFGIKFEWQLSDRDESNVNSTLFATQMLRFRAKWRVCPGVEGSLTEIVQWQ